MLYIAWVCDECAEDWVFKETDFTNHFKQCEFCGKLNHCRSLILVKRRDDHLEIPMGIITPETVEETMRRDAKIMLSEKCKEVLRKDREIKELREELARWKRKTHNLEESLHEEIRKFFWKDERK